MEGSREANNSELVNIFGNFVNRTFVLMHKLCRESSRYCMLMLWIVQTKAVFFGNPKLKLNIERIGRI